MSAIRARNAERARRDRQKTKSARRIRKAIEQLEMLVREAAGWNHEGGFATLRTEAESLIQCLKWARGDYGEPAPDEKLCIAAGAIVDRIMARYQSEKYGQTPGDGTAQDSGEAIQ